VPGLPVNRLLIKQRLFNLAATATFTAPINGYTTWASSSRRLRLWVNVDSGQQPALFLVQHRGTRRATGTGNLMRRYLDMGFWCYAPSGDESIVGDDLLDIMETALESVMVPDNPQMNELTLGGLVYWTRLVQDDGLYIRDPGDIDGQALLVLPVRCLIP
jgi:hypothetical protein